MRVEFSILYKKPRTRSLLVFSPTIPLPSRSRMIGQTTDTMPLDPKIIAAAK